MDLKFKSMPQDTDCHKMLQTEIRISTFILLITFLDVSYSRHLGIIRNSNGQNKK